MVESSRRREVGVGASGSTRRLRRAEATVTIGSDMVLTGKANTTAMLCCTANANSVDRASVLDMPLKV